MRPCSGVRLSAARGEPFAFIDLTHRFTVLLPRSHSSMISRLSLLALCKSTIRLLNSSVKCLGAWGPHVRPSRLSHPSRNCLCQCSRSTVDSVTAARMGIATSTRPGETMDLI